MSFLLGRGTYTPLLVPRIFETEIDSSFLSSKSEFAMTKGYTTLSFSDENTNFTFSFDVMGGYGDTLENHNSSLFIVQDTEVGCEVEYPPTYNVGYSTTYLIKTPPADSGGRTYQVTFLNNPSLKPNIRKISGTDLGTSLLVTSNDRIKFF